MARMAEDQAAILLRPDALDDIDDVLVRPGLDAERIEAGRRTVLLVAEYPNSDVPVHSVPSHQARQ
jgi:hypothetical protein